MLMPLLHCTNAQASSSKFWQHERSCSCCQQTGSQEATFTLDCPSLDPPYRKVSILAKHFFVVLCSSLSLNLMTRKTHISIPNNGHINRSRRMHLWIVCAVRAPTLDTMNYVPRSSLRHWRASYKPRTFTSSSALDIY